MNTKGQNGLFHYTPEVCSKRSAAFFEKWVERCKKCIACQGRYFEKRPLPHLHKIPTRSNKVNPRNFQTALVCMYVCMYVLICVCIIVHNFICSGDYSIHNYLAFVNVHKAFSAGRSKH
jgi:hypothetical protein